MSSFARKHEFSLTDVSQDTSESPRCHGSTPAVLFVDIKDDRNRLLLLFPRVWFAALERLGETVRRNYTLHHLFCHTGQINDDQEVFVSFLHFRGFVSRRINSSAISLLITGQVADLAVVEDVVDCVE